MNVYHYDEKTKVFTEITEADADPEETILQGRFVPLVPANATLVKIPECGEFEVPVFETDNWVVKKDYRKTHYAVDDEFNVTDIKEVGDVDGYVVTKEVGEDIKANPDHYKISNNKVVKKSNKEITELEKQKERERIGMLSLTKREVFLAIYKDKQITPEQVRASITNPEALIEFDYASEYYRGNPLIDEIGQKLGYTTEQLDQLFENGELPVQ